MLSVIKTLFRVVTVLFDNFRDDRNHKQLFPPFYYFKWLLIFMLPRLSNVYSLIAAVHPNVIHLEQHRQRWMC